MRLRNLTVQKPCNGYYKVVQRAAPDEKESSSDMMAPNANPVYTGRSDPRRPSLCRPDLAWLCPGIRDESLPAGSRSLPFHRPCGITGEKGTTVRGIRSGWLFFVRRRELHVFLLLEDEGFSPVAELFVRGNTECPSVSF